MMIKPSAAIRNNYRKVADYCIETGQPVFLTNIAVCIIVNMKFKAKTMIVTRKNLFIKEPTALMAKASW